MKIPFIFKKKNARVKTFSVSLYCVLKLVCRIDKTLFSYYANGHRRGGLN